MPVRSPTRRNTRRVSRTPLTGASTRLPPNRADLIAEYRRTITGGRLMPYRPAGSATPQVKGSLFSVAAPEDVPYTGLLTTDVITTPHGTVTDGVELVTNGIFSNGTTGWAFAGPGLPTGAIVGGELEITTTVAAYGYASQNVTTEVGKTYRLTGVGRRGTALNTINIQLGTAQVIANSLINTVLSVDFVATGATTSVALVSDSDAGIGTAYFDNISVQCAIQATPTCAVDGTLSMSANFWDMSIHRAGVLWSYLPGINVGQATELDASGNGHHLTLTTTTITERADGTGTNWANERGFTVADGSQYLDADAVDVIGAGWRIPTLIDGSGAASWSGSTSPLEMLAATTMLATLEMI